MIHIAENYINSNVYYLVNFFFLLPICSFPCFLDHIYYCENCFSSVHNDRLFITNTKKSIRLTYSRFSYRMIYILIKKWLRKQSLDSNWLNFYRFIRKKKNVLKEKKTKNILLYCIYIYISWKYRFLVILYSF